MLLCKRLGLLFGIIALIFLLLSGYYVVSGKHHAYKTEMAARSAFMQIAEALANRAYHFPTVERFPGEWVPDLRVLYPEYLSDLTVLVSPYHPDEQNLKLQLKQCLEQEEPDWEKIHRIAAQSIVFSGYALQLEADLEVFIKAGMPQTNHEILFEGYRIYRARESVERFLLDNKHLRFHLGLKSSPPVIIMEQPALSAYRPKPGLLIVGPLGYRKVEFIPEGYGFPALASVAHAFPPPPLD